MAERIADNLYRLDIPLPNNPLKNLNSYLFTGERNLLVDTGFRLDACRDALMAELASVGADLSRTDLFLSHLHSDHTGLASELYRPHCQIFLSKIDGPLMMDREAENTWNDLFVQYRAMGFSQEELGGIWKENPAKVLASSALPGFTALDQGDKLCYGGYELTGLLTPGHTPGHMCLYDEKKKLMLCGDHVLFHITPNITRWDAMDAALSAYLDSVAAIQDLPVDTLLPAHRLVEGTLGTRCRELTAHHAARIEDAYNAVARHPGQTAYQITGLMRWEIKCRSWEDFPPTQKWFAVGEALAHLDYLERRGRVVTTRENDQVHYWPAPGTLS